MDVEDCLAQDLAAIRSNLQPFAKEETPAPLRTISSLSTESSTNSVCSDTPCFSSVQEALHRLGQLGIDEVILAVFLLRQTLISRPLKLIIATNFANLLPQREVFGMRSFSSLILNTNIS